MSYYKEIEHMLRSDLLYELERAAVNPHKYRKYSTERLRQALRARERMNNEPASKD